jgi:hypothetical protein
LIDKVLHLTLFQTLGAIGRIARIDSDGDVRVKVGDRVWIYSPVCCCPLEDQALSKKAPDLTKSEMEHGEVDDLKQMQRDMERKYKTNVEHER